MIFVEYIGTKPHQATPGSNGLDLEYAGPDYYEIPPGGRSLMPTGLRVAIPSGYVGLVCPRSGLANRIGITVLNAPGVIDSDYRGEVGVLLVNQGPVGHVFKPGDRIAQLVIVPSPSVGLCKVKSLDETERGFQGWGSSGK